ncbi:MAG TPA: D-2-hydroxyacid dehydrogenase [Candidatus Saccharimonadales bacterium]|nr:D-2-hydroxyacid dehydrogenase [Candidatus Saccharimonadales bacterium]
MNIVVLDGYTLNPGDLSWEPLKQLGACTIHDRIPHSAVVEKAREAEVVLTNKVPVTAEQIAQLPKLKYVGVLATGYNIVDVAAARQRNIPVTNIPAYGTRSVAQMTFALLLELAQHTGHHARTVAEGKWSECPDFCYWDYPLIELEGMTMGVIGFGRIGRAVAELASAFGMKVKVLSRSQSGTLKPGWEFVTEEQLFRTSDFVSLHCPLTEETKHMINARRLSWMKPTAFLLNTSRGGLVDEPALATALNKGQIAGAGLDVLSQEPPPSTNPLISAKNCIITPHIAWATHAARSRLMATAVANLKAFVGGKPQNVVNS